MRLQTRFGPRRGATAVETAVVISIALLFMFGVFEYGRYVMTRQIMENAAREGARFAVVHTNDKTTAQIQNQVDFKLDRGRQQIKNYVKTTNIQVFASDVNGNPIGGKTWSDSAYGELIGVSISGTYKSILPSFLHWSSSFTVSAKSVMASEGN